MTSIVAGSRTTSAWPGKGAAWVARVGLMRCSVAGQVIAVEDLGAVAGDQVGQGGVELTDQRPEPPRRVAHEAAADARLDPLELLVDGRQRGGDLAEGGQVGGADRGMDPADDEAHQVDDRGEEQLAGVLAWWRSARRVGSVRRGRGRVPAGRGT